ncbi:HAMP domain-containing histidine kinase [Cohnella pontilimi]|uniref:histidine kinase n=1 Tax=Cohnella pontilimi TaxID=2564100 RepID=A0A4U0FBH6_9BACL|nr:HAMP domain-containing sensor histidine kinase [Cohnella pontilimi]TJY42203.1 HAMP domain-containing histidine kinase [Cohnella pontilimi]
MSIKSRLLLSYIAMTFIPVILFAMIAAALASVFLKDTPGGRNGPPFFQQMSSEQQELFTGMKFIAQTEPDRLSDPVFLDKMGERMNRLKTRMVVEKNGNVIHTMSNAPSPSTEHSTAKYDFTFGDGSRGTLLMMTAGNPWSGGEHTFFPLLLLSLLTVIALTNGVLTYLVSRSIIKPLYALKYAAEQIKDGDLSHEVALKRKDEIGELGGAFEQMRVRLNESIRLQLQYEENRKELISNISHDLKTPISGIKACLEGIQEGIAESGPMREKYMEMIEKKTDEMNRLIDELLLFSKLDLNRLPFDLERVDLAAYLRDCLEELQLDPLLAGVTVNFSRSGESLYVVADREKLRRVIMNIIDNSLKYMDKPHPEIRVELRDDQNEATVGIRDNGSGIEAAVLPLIFDRFYRADPSRNAKTGGSGLGLAIVKQLVEGQGGKVWAESVPGEGTGIYFTLPRSKNGGEQT